MPWTGQRLLGEYTGGYWKVIGGLGVEVAVDEDEGAELYLMFQGRDDEEFGWRCFHCDAFVWNLWYEEIVIGGRYSRPHLYYKLYSKELWHLRELQRVRRRRSGDGMIHPCQKTSCFKVRFVWISVTLMISSQTAIAKLTSAHGSTDSGPSQTETGHSCHFLFEQWDYSMDLSTLGQATKCQENQELVREGM